MSIVIEEPRLLHALPGRMRVHLAAWPREGQRAVETRLCQVQGVHSVRINPLTGNVLIHFDPTATDEQTLLAVVQTSKPDSISRRGEIRPISLGVPQRQRSSRSASGAGPCLAADPDLAVRTTILPSERPRSLGLDICDLILKAAGLAVSLILADSPFGLILSGLEVLRLLMEVVGRGSARRRGEVEQEHSRFTLITAGDAGAVDRREPMGRGQTRRDARAHRSHRLAGRPAAV